jgi:hypothetical protein
MLSFNLATKQIIIILAIKHYIKYFTIDLKINVFETRLDQNQKELKINRPTPLKNVTKV